jgi:hypothetical protein
VDGLSKEDGEIWIIIKRGVVEDEEEEETCVDGLVECEKDGVCDVKE